MNKHNKKRIYILAELDVTEKKDLPKQTNIFFFFDKERIKQKR